MPGLLEQITDVSRTKGIDPDIVIEAIKDAIIVAARKYYKTAEDLEAAVTSERGIEVFSIKQVVDLVTNPAKEVGVAEAREVHPNAEVGDEVRFAKPTEGLGRISAQLAKQVIFQKIREAERDMICKEFEGRLGQMETCLIKRIEGPDLIVELGRTEARLPRREQSRLESFSPGDRVRIIVKMIEKAGRGPAVIVSRASEELVRRLFEQEVPEIYDGTVEIRAVAREAGERTKIAVYSNDRDVDAVGACVGMKGSRVQSIIRELRGEKIDIIEFSEDSVEMAGRALSPAKISRVTVIDPLQRHLEVIVDDTQLSLAIGKKGQNVRLAAKLLGWRIDIKSEEEKRQEVELAMEQMVSSGTPISVLMDHALPEPLVDKLVEGGVTTVERLADMTPEDLTALPGLDEEALDPLQSAVNAYYSQFQTEAPVQEAEPAAEQEAPPAVPDAGTPITPPGFVPGLPVEGAADEEDDDDEVIYMEDLEMNDFGTMAEGSGDVASDQGDDTEPMAVDGEEAPPQEASVAETSPAADGEEPNNDDVKA